MFFVRATFMFFLYVYGIERISKIFVPDMMNMGNGSGALFFVFIIGWSVVCACIFRVRSHEMQEHIKTLHAR